MKIKFSIFFKLELKFPGRVVRVLGLVFQQAEFVSYLGLHFFCINVYLKRTKMNKERPSFGHFKKVKFHGLVVRVLVIQQSEFESYLSLKYFFVKFLFEKNENEQEEAVVGPFLKKVKFSPHHRLRALIYFKLNENERVPMDGWVYHIYNRRLSLYR